MKLMDNDIVDAMRITLEKLKIWSLNMQLNLHKTERCQNKPNYKIKSLLPLEENKTD